MSFVDEKDFTFFLSMYFDVVYIFNKVLFTILEIYKYDICKCFSNMLLLYITFCICRLFNFPYV